MSNGIKNIIFDISEVLLTGIKDTGIALAEKHKLEEPEHLVGWTTIKTPLLTPLVEELFNGNVSEDEYIKDIILKYPQIGDEQWLKQHIRENFREVEGTRQIIMELRGRGYKLALLSVHAKEWVDYCEKEFDYHQLFDEKVYSYETRYSKPHQMSFVHALQKLKATPDECLFIDDSLVNIEAAQKLGITAILFTRADDLRKELSKTLTNF